MPISNCLPVIIRDLSLLFVHLFGTHLPWNCWNFAHVRIWGRSPDRLLWFAVTITVTGCINMIHNKLNQNARHNGSAWDRPPSLRKISSKLVQQFRRRSSRIDRQKNSKINIPNYHWVIISLVSRCRFDAVNLEQLRLCVTQC